MDSFSIFGSLPRGTSTKLQIIMSSKEEAHIRAQSKSDVPEQDTQLKSVYFKTAFPRNKVQGKILKKSPSHKRTLRAAHVVLQQ